MTPERIACLRDAAEYVLSSGPNRAAASLDGTELTEVLDALDRLAAIDALHHPAPERLQGSTICDDCCADWPCPTNRTKETT